MAASFVGTARKRYEELTACESPVDLDRSQVTETLGSISQRIDFLEQMVKEIATKIRPVLLPASPSTGEKCEGHGSVCELVEHMLTLCDRLDAMNATLSELNSRIAL